MIEYMQLLPRSAAESPCASDLILTHILPSDTIQDEHTRTVGPQELGRANLWGVQLHDLRRTRRTVQAASSMAANPLGSLPAHMQGWKETKAMYRLLDEPDVTFAALLQPHLHQTRDQAHASPLD